MHTHRSWRAAFVQPSMGADALENGLGFAGGLLLGVCLVPEVWHVWRTKSASDLSWLWLIIYGCGLALSVAYLFLIGALAGWATMLIEIGLVGVMMALKMW